MHSYCSRCFTRETEPVQADTGDLIYWFVLQQDDYIDELITLGLDETGNITNMFVGIPEKEFVYDETFKLICPDCVVDEMDRMGDFNEEDNED